MEDISRELEREIAKAKPTPYKTSRKKKVLVVDDFGEMKSGTYLKVLVRFFAVTSVIFGMAAGGLYVLYDRLSGQSVRMQSELAHLEGRTKQLTREKEILMARLVMVGEKPVLETAKASAQAVNETLEKKSPSESKETAPEVDRSSQVDALPEKTVEPEGTRMALDDAPEEDGAEVESPVQEGGYQVQSGLEQSTGTDGNSRSQLVSVEKFSISKAPESGEFRVRFNIRNIKKGPGEISGRIFLVLKPSSGTQDDWIVVPKAPVKDGVPVDYKRGQYFSISRFKPVRFTINSPLKVKALSSAAVYIFGEEGDVLYQDVMEISLDGEG